MQKRCKSAAAFFMIMCCVFGWGGAVSVYGTAVEEEIEAEIEPVTGTEAKAESQAGKESGAELGKHKIRIGYIDYEGFISQEEDGTYVGYGVEYFGEIAGYTGWEYEYVYDSWENQLQRLTDGDIDFICHAQKTEQRETQYLFSKYSVGCESSMLYVRQDDDRYYYNDFEAFEGMKIAVLDESYHNTELSEYAHKKGFSFQFVPYDTQEECFDALDAKTVDAVALGSLALKSEYKIVCRFGCDPFYFMAAKANQDLMDQLNDALGQITASSFAFQSRIYQKYYGANAEKGVTFTRQEAEYIQEAGVIGIACIPSGEPFSYVDENGELAGVTIAVLNLIEDRSGLTFRYTMIPEGTQAVEFLSRNPDMIVAGVISGSQSFQEEKYLLTDSFYTDDVVLACLSGQNYDLSAGNGTYKLAIPRNYAAFEDYIKRTYPQFEIVTCMTIEECLDMVLRGKADFTAQNGNVLKPYLTNPYYDKLTIVPTFFMEENGAIACLDSQENRIIMSIMNKCMAAITQKQLAQFIVDHTISNQYELIWNDIMYKLRYITIVIGILLATVILLMLSFIILRKRSYRRLEEKNSQLAEAVAQANSANRAKSQFLARMSHEIRTPMNAIVGLTAIARHHREEPEQVEKYLGKIETSSKVLLNIINDVLDMSAIERGKIKIAQKPFDLREVLASIAAVYHTQYRHKDVTFEMNMRQLSDVYVTGDGLHLNQVLLNLVSNAYKFTPGGGKVSVTAKEVGRQGEQAYYKFMVEDTGEGMTEEMLHRLFLPFEQEEPDTAQKHGGSGLGLSIAKNLVELMGGSISCRSKKGKGTVFTVMIPFVLEEKEGVVAQEIYPYPEAPAAEWEYDFGGRKILLAEDTEMSADIVQELLELVNMKVDHAWNGEEAVEMFAESEPGSYVAILMDVQMPVMNGYQAVALIRSLYHSDAASIPIYAMTANAFTSDVSAALNAGMNGHIAKPIDTRILFEILRREVERR